MWCSEHVCRLLYLRVRHLKVFISHEKCVGTLTGYGECEDEESLVYGGCLEVTRNVVVVRNAVDYTGCEECGAASMSAASSMSASVI